MRRLEGGGDWSLEGEEVGREKYVAVAIKCVLHDENYRWESIYETNLLDFFFAPSMRYLSPEDQLSLLRAFRRIW